MRSLLLHPSRGIVPRSGSHSGLRRVSASAAATQFSQPRMLKVPNLQGFLDRIAEVNTATAEDIASFVPLLAQGKVAGYLRPAVADCLLDYRDVFHRAAAGGPVSFAASLDTQEKRTAAVGKVARDLADSGLIKGWRNEYYPAVGSFHEQPHFLIERAAAPYFGVKAYGVHVNGYVRKGDELFLWVARRSRSKPTWPGQLDHIVAGGQPFGLSCFDNVVKEAEEEASIPESLARRALPCGAVSYATLAPEGLKRDVLFVYDIELPEDFVPTPRDGEVEEFFLLPIAQAAEIVRTTKDYKPNCTIVIIDFLVRHGFITPEHQGFLDVVKALRQGDCA